MKIRVLLGVLILLLVGVSCAYGFDDTFQDYIVGVSDNWFVYDVTGSGAFSIVNSPVMYSTSNAVDARVSGGWPVGPLSITTKETFSSNYFAFRVVDGYLYRNSQFSYNTHLNYYNANDDSLEVSYDLNKGFGLAPLETSAPILGFYEFKKSGNSIILFIDGVEIETIGACTASDIYVELDFASGTPPEMWVILDDFTTSSIIGVNEEWTQAPTNIDTSYGVQSMFSFPTAVYTLETKHVGTGTVINTTTLPSNQGAGDKPAGFVRWNRNDIFGSNWGLYHVQLFRDSTKLAETTFTYFDSTISGSVAFDQDSYSQGQTANIAYTISSADFASYTYYLKTMNVLGTVEDTYTLTAASGTKSPVLEDYDSGVYYAILSRTSKSSGTNEEFAYDYASVTETVYVNGNVTDAVSGTKMHNVSIEYLQGSTYYNTTSALDGTYNVSDLSVGLSTAITANVTYTNDSTFGNNSYNLSTFSFTPLAAEIYDIDLILFDINHTYNNVSTYGLIYDSIYHQPIESATVNIFNGTWSNSTTSTATGYYVFHNLIANGTYSINTTASGYTDSIDYDINTTTINATRQDIGLSQLYTVTVMARDAVSTAYLSDYTAYLDGSAQDATSGSVIFTDVEYGLHSISAVASGYYPTGTTPLIDEDTTITIDLTTTPSEYYAPHKVKFTVKSLWGTLYSGVTTSVYTGGTATGDTLYTGTTGTDGAVVFELSEEVQYTITFIDETQNIDETRTLYPIHIEYTIIVFGANLIPDDRPSDDILFGCYGKTINMTHGYINVSFNDTSGTTTLAELWINDTNQTQLYYFNTTDSDKAWSQVVDGGNASYVVTFKLNNTVLDEQLVITRTIHFNDEVRVNLGLDEGWKYQLIAVIIISVIALLGSALNAEIIAVITVLVGWLMVFFGWLQAGATIPEQITLGLMMLFATLLAFGSVIRKGDAR